MAYTDVISLSDAKDYLKVEHTDSDSEITAMINAACAYIEKVTGHILYSRNISYNLPDRNWIVVHDHPITAVVKGLDEDGSDVTLTLRTNYDVLIKTLHNKYVDIDSEAIQLILTVGYASASSVPPGLIEAAKMIIKSLYYNQDIESMDDAVPLSAKMIIDVHRRFLI